MLSSKIRLTNEEMKYIALFENTTGATAKDCLLDEKNNRIIFVAKEGEAGLAIGKNGKKIEILKKLTGKPIEVVEYADKPEPLIKNALYPAKIKNTRKIEKNGKTTIIVEVDPKDKALAIGKNGKTIEKARMLVKRYFQIDRVMIV
ncbi:NusA-like transcription termination signal-binding factor [Candidatus Bathyarchaeota archaeon]|nr:NusA-like transcription termination signal-binding factor [Candidatus Bathyarchaeota archaeon]